MVTMKEKSAAAEAAFRARVTELGGTGPGGPWLGSRKPHAVLCAEGHPCNPRPDSLAKGQGMCRVCAGNDPATAEAAFRARVAELGGEVLEELWLGKNTRHRVRCVAGHECNPRPGDVRNGGGICRVCAGNDPNTAEAAFRVRVAELGGEVLEASWLGSLAPHKVRCAEGHESSPAPHDVARGQGLCTRCRGHAADVFYVVTGPAGVKFGITSGDPSARLRAHKSEAGGGYARVLAVFACLPEGVARATEDGCRAALKSAGFTPVRGREYFSLEALPLVLQVAAPLAGKVVTATG